MPETDMIVMSLVIFLPSIFALILLFFPKGTEEYMRWFALLGTAVTLVASLWMFIDYYNMFQYYPSVPGQVEKQGSLLNVRADQADMDSDAHKERKGKDMIGRYPWIAQFHIDYYLGADGISMSLVLLTTVLSLLAMIASWNIEKYVKGYLALFLLLETGMLGTFLALDFFLFYIFWEVMLLPMYFLIGVWGGPRREYAAIKFFLYTLLGSVFILIAMLAFYLTDVNVGGLVPGAKPAENKNTFDILLLQKAGRFASQLIKDNDALAKAEAELQAAGDSKDDVRIAKAQAEVNRLRASNPVAKAADRLNKVVREKGTDVEIRQAQSELDRLKQPFFSSSTFQVIMFLLLFVGFAIKVPLFPFHTWLPDAHVEAPTPISMILAGVLLKMGGYGILRIAYPICPWAAEYLALIIGIFAMINIVYGAFAAMAQTDFKKLVAYSSVSHMGYVILGIAVWSSTGQQYWSWGMNGAMFQMIAHGISSAGMFFLVGVIYDRAHHRNLDNFRGLYEPMPLYGGISAIIFFAAMGLPGLCGFIGEAMVVIGTWNFKPDAFPAAGMVFSVLAALTVVLTAGYILWTLQRVFMGQNPAYKSYPEINLRELLCIVPLVVLAVVLGVAPQLLLSWMSPSVSGLVQTLAQVGPIKQ